MIRRVFVTTPMIAIKHEPILHKSYVNKQKRSLKQHTQQLTLVSETIYYKRDTTIYRCTYEDLNSGQFITYSCR